MNNLEMLQAGLSMLLRQEADAQAALENARIARIRQEGALEWEQARQEMEAKASAAPAPQPEPAAEQEG